MLSLFPSALTPENLVQAEECLFAASEITAGSRLNKCGPFAKFMS